MAAFLTHDWPRMTEEVATRAHAALASDCWCGGKEAKLCLRRKPKYVAVVLQCQRCGRQRGADLPRSEIVNWDSLSPFDEEQADKYWRNEQRSGSAWPARPIPETEPEKPTRKTEDEVCSDLEREFRALGDRCAWYPQVWMNCFTHAQKGQIDRLRIDYVVQIEDGPLLGVEVKARPESPSDLGRGLFQCAQYAHGVIAAQTADRIPGAWVGRPLTAVFLFLDTADIRENIAQHGRAAHRLYGPANVGFLFRTSRRLEMRLSGDRFWCSEYGYNQGKIVSGKTYRSGNASVRPEAANDGDA